MGTKLWTALCALLLINFGSADDGDHATASPTSKGPLRAETVAPVTKSVPDSGSSSTSHAPNSSETNTSSSGNSINATAEPNPVASGKDNVDGVKNETQRNQPSSLPSAPPTESSTTHTPTSPANSNATHHTSSVAITATPSPDHNTHNNISEHPLSDSTTQSHQPSPTTAPSVTSSSTSVPPKPQTTPSSTLTTPTTQSTSTSSTSSTHVATAPAQTSQSSSTAHPKTTSSPPSTPSARTNADSPSQLNMGGDAKKDSPALDPLLAGLVSAFIITAVIITLLLFLKLRRRDNGPEFRRLQDLPMDDMMEETPLSMYSY